MSQNLIITIDASSSMSERFGASTRIEAVNNGVEMMIPHLSRQRGTMIGLVGYNHRPFVVSPLVWPTSRNLVGRVKSIRLGGLTNLLGGIDLSINLLVKRPPCFPRRVIALTDGFHNVGGLTPERIIVKAQRNSVVVDTIGVGNSEISFNKRLLEDISYQTGGEFITVKDLPKMLATFRQLSSPKPFRPGGGKGNAMPKGVNKPKGKLIPFNLFRRAA